MVYRNGVKNIQAVAYNGVRYWLWRIEGAEQDKFGGPDGI